MRPLLTRSRTITLTAADDTRPHGDQSNAGGSFFGTFKSMFKTGIVEMLTESLAVPARPSPVKPRVTLATADEWKADHNAGAAPSAAAAVGAEQADLLDVVRQTSLAEGRPAALGTAHLNRTLEL